MWVWNQYVLKMDFQIHVLKTLPHTLLLLFYAQLNNNTQLKYNFNTKIGIIPLIFFSNSQNNPW